jgi:hypothetical protein
VILRDLRGDLNFLRSGGFQSFLPLANDRVFSVSSVSSVVKGIAHAKAPSAPREKEIRNSEYVKSR